MSFLIVFVPQGEMKERDWVRYLKSFLFHYQLMGFSLSFTNLVLNLESGKKKCPEEDKTRSGEELREKSLWIPSGFYEDEADKKRE